MIALFIPNSCASRQTAQAKIGLTTEAAKDIANIVGRPDPFVKCAVPPVENPLHNLNSCVEKVLDGDGEAILVENNKMLVRAVSRRWPVEIGALKHVSGIHLSLPGACCFLPVLMTMVRLKSTSFEMVIRTSTSRMALSSCAVMQDTPVPFV